MSKPEETIPSFPITSWTMSIHPGYQAISFQPYYLPHSLHPIEQAEQGPMYVLSAAQAFALAEQIMSALARLETESFQAPTNQKH